MTASSRIELQGRATSASTRRLKHVMSVDRMAQQARTACGCSCCEGGRGAVAKPTCLAGVILTEMIRLRDYRYEFEEDME